MRIPAAVLLLLLCLRAIADTPHAQPPCTCTVNFPPTQSALVTRELKRATCHCAVTSPTVATDIRGTAQAPLKVDVHDLPRDHSSAVIAVAAVAMVLLTGALAFYTANLWRATRKLIENGQASAQRQLRAYVGVSEVAGRYFGLLWGDLMVSVLLRVREAPGPQETERRAQDAATNLLRLYPEAPAAP